MVKDNIYSNMNGWYRLLYLFLFFIGGVFVAISLTMVLSTIIGTENINSSVPFLKCAQLIQAISMFLLPAILYLYMFRDNQTSQLEFKNLPPVTALLITVLLVIIAQPIIQLTSFYNQQMVLPESMHAIEEWMRKSEQSVERIVELFLLDKSLMSYVSNIFIIAIVAGIVEEFFFRGCLQRIFLKITNNHHAAIWITAIIFSTIHFQFYGFIPRLIAGAMLGYLFVATRTLWLPILAHILHNAFNLIVSQRYYGTPDYDTLEYMGIEQHKWLGYFSLVVLGVVIFIIKKKRVFSQNVKDNKN